MTLADKIVVLNEGRVEQVGGPLELYHRPRNRFVAGFIGSPKMNFLAAKVAGVSGQQAHFRLAGGAEIVADVQQQGLAVGEAATLGVRPEHLLNSTAAAAGSMVRVEVSVVEHLGGLTYAYARLGDATPLTVQLPGDSHVRAGGALDVCLPRMSCHVFNSAGERV